MRTFETALILVNLLTLLLAFKKQPKAVWLGSAGVNLALLFIHGLFEGFRYQMAFSYFFALQFVVYAFIKIRDRNLEARTPKVLKFGAMGLAFILLAFTAFLAYALPVFTLPEPTGSYVVGVTYFHFIDENRTDPFLDTLSQKRELMVKVYYPAEPDDAKPVDGYFNDSSELVRSYAAFYHMPEFIFDHLRLVKTNAKADLSVSGQQQRYPVILFSHGAGTTMEVQTSQSDDLASHGYIVAAIDHTYVSAATVFPDNVVFHHEATTDFKTAEPAEVITQIMADDASFVIDALGELNEGIVDSIFRGRLNLEQIGAVGHSVGGATAYNLVMNDARVKAAVNLDGVVYITPTADPNDAPPFLMLANDRYHIEVVQERRPLMKPYDNMDDIEREITLGIYGSQEAYDEAYEKASQNVSGLSEVLEASGNLFTIEGSDHMKFTDIGLFIGFKPLRELINIGGSTEPARCLEITQAVTVAFFDEQLKGETTHSLEALVQRYPELKGGEQYK